MDKNTYETYEFQSTETDANQFFVVQDDGSFLLNRPVQYVTQVQDVKEALDDVQPCTVYDVSSQQFFVDVDNSAELISVSDQFILPESENGLYNNSYLLQPTSSDTLEETKMNEDLIEDQYKETDTQDVDVDAVTYNSKQSNHFTEITLSDDQYRTLEQKGWILLESFNKIFVLNTLGLHDITTNEKLIQKLKNELQNSNPGYEGCIKTENIQSQLPNIVTQSLPNQQETVEFVIGNSDEQDENSAMESYEFVVDEDDITERKVEKQNIEEQNMEAEDINKSPKHEIDTINPRKNAKSMKIKTKLTFKDIPDNILLGKSANGKRIVAKVTNRQLPPKAKVNEENTQGQHFNVTGLSEAQFVSLIQQSVRGRLQGMTTTEDVAFAENVVAQLLKVPNMNVSLNEQSLIITKAVSDKDEFGVMDNKCQVKVVTGRLVFKDNEYTFENLPDMLQNITKPRSDDPIASNNDVYDAEESNNITVFHIHVSETRSSDNIARISVTLNKRQLSLNLIYDLKRRYPYTIFACGACATTFKNEEALKDHKKNQCLYADKNLTIDTENENTKTIYSIIRDRKRKEFICALCNAKFKSIRSCQRHINTHVGPNQSNTDTDTALNEADSPKKSSNAVYKCKMCSSTYFHPSTLSKHIVTRHINVKSNQ